MKTLTLAALSFALSFGLAFAQENPTLDESALLISRVQHMPASELDSTLPHTPFERWLRLQIGNDAKVAWVIRTGEGHGLPWVEADISVGNRPGIVIMVACGRHNKETKVRPTFRSLELLRQGELREWPHLHDLPTAMRKARSES